MHDWLDWTEHVLTDLLEGLSLLVTEIPPDDALQHRIVLERDGIWYKDEWSHWPTGKKPLLTALTY